MINSSVMKSTPVINLYKGKTCIEHNIKLYTPIDEELLKKMQDRPDLLGQVFNSLNEDIEEKLMDVFESDIHSIYTCLKGKLHDADINYNTTTE